MFELTGDAEYLDIVERAMFNGILSGIHPVGNKYFYDNPLESRGDHRQKAWFGCSCCPPNLARFIASIDRYSLFRTQDIFYVGVPISGVFEIAAGTSVKIITDYPNPGPVTIEFLNDSPSEFGVAIRIPEWAEETSVNIPGCEREAEYIQGFAVYRSSWKSGQQIVINFDAQPKWNFCHPAVTDNLQRTTLSCGPTVYCAVSKTPQKQPQAAILFSLPEVKATRNGYSSPALFFNGQSDRLYLDSEPKFEETEGEMEFVPYRTWAEHGPTNMQVWVKYSAE
jgi:hypothetical protein